MASSSVDRSCLLCRAGKPHNPVIGHLTETHSLPATANYLLTSVMRGDTDEDIAGMLAAIRSHRDDDPDSSTFGCLRWYAESPKVQDTNAAFFVCTPLSAIWLACRDRLNSAEGEQLQGVFRDVAPWFTRMGESPSLFYPNKCISDAAMLLATGHILADPDLVERGRALTRRFFEYTARRGMGWGEDHSPVYTRVIVDMTLLIMALEKEGALCNDARAMTDAIADWADFHDGYDAVPSIRGYNFDAQQHVRYGVAKLWEDIGEPAPGDLTSLLMTLTGYTYTRKAQSIPRQRRWRTFDEHTSTTFIDCRSRLGTLSHYPLMPNTAMHDSWGLGWQSKPCAFIVHDHDYGVLEWCSEDDDGVVRQHESAGGMHDWPSRHLVKRISFHPDVSTVCHQHRSAAIIFREIRRLHSPLRRLVDRWRLAQAGGQVLVDGKTIKPGVALPPESWIVLDYPHCAVALYPLQCRGVAPPPDEANPQRRMRGPIAPPAVRFNTNARGAMLAVPLAEDHAGVVSEHLLFSGWCAVLLNSPEDATQLRVTETFHHDDELPRTYGELIRCVTLQTPDTTLTLKRDMLTGKTTRDGSSTKDPLRFCSAKP